MVGTARQKDYEQRADLFLEHAETAHQKWNGSTWLRARHLFGCLCIEERRSWFAAELLELMDYGDELDRGLVHPPLLPYSRPQPADAVDWLLHDRLRACHADGTLGNELATWGFWEPAVLKELLLLAAAPPRSTTSKTLRNCH